MLFIQLIFEYVISAHSSLGLSTESPQDDELNKVKAYIVSLFRDTGGDMKLVYSFSAHIPLMAELVLCRSIDNYLVYLSQLLALIFRTKPETLKSGEQERLDFILKHSSMDDLIGALAEKRVDKLAYMGMRDLARYFEEKLGLNCFHRLKAWTGRYASSN
ncbi:MAG: hypothetical protein M3430_13505 [Acidobacteriota bacterium]|nr:hypothetical protein [Acidobacteriota bacterium]